jgi:hypothetical protein
VRNLAVILLTDLVHSENNLANLDQSLQLDTPPGSHTRQISVQISPPDVIIKPSSSSK